MRTIRVTISIAKCETKLNLNKNITKLVVEIPCVVDERDHLLNTLSTIDHIESIYLLGKPSKISTERSEFFNRFRKVCIFCEDERKLALRWTMDTVEECQILGDQYIKEDKKDIAREHFQRGMVLFERLSSLIDSARQK